MKYLAYLAIFVLFQHAITDPVQQNASTTTTISTTPTTTKEMHHASECELSESSMFEKKLLGRLNQFKGRKFTWEDKEHKYFMSICSQAENGSFSDEAFIQLEKNSDKTRRWVIGRLNDVDLEGNEEFIRVNYKNGDTYEHACSKTNRNAIFYLICDENKINPEFFMIEENNDRLNQCAYVFMLKTKDMCLKKDQTTATSTTTKTTTVQASSSSTKASDPTTTPTANTNSTSTLPSEKKSKLGVLSIILIALTGLLAVYFIVGTLYMRFVNQATGWEQIPNFGFWNAIGEGSADLCNLICRCGNRRTEIHTYENINDHISDDENLLNM